ncbi:hypothetical protein Hanom_Chr14g01303491 [Helianthus anomalus]
MCFMKISFARKRKKHTHTHTHGTTGLEHCVVGKHQLFTAFRNGIVQARITMAPTSTK